MAGRCNASQDAQDAWEAGDASLASGRNADGSDAGSVFADVPMLPFCGRLVAATCLLPASLLDTPARQLSFHDTLSPLNPSLTSL